MRRPEWWSLAADEQEIYHAAFRFLGERLEERETMQWAMALGPIEKAKRLAVIDLVGNRRNKELTTPWLEAWHLIIDNWSRPVIERNSHTGVYEVRERLKSGEYTNGVISEIVDLVTPNLKIRMVDNDRRVGGSRSKKIKVREDLISCTLTSGRILDIDDLKLVEVEDKGFLFSLATALDNLIVSSLDLARRIGWDGEHNYWILGQMHRVYYVYEKNENGRDSEPDEFADGIVPAVKLLYEVLVRLADVDLGSAASFVTRWKPEDSQIHLRLMAALFRDGRFASQDNLNTFFLQLNERQFWKLETYPEVAELRANRFNELGSEAKNEVLKRVKKGPPRSHYHRSMEKDRIKEARKYCATREMKRIQLAGGELPEKSRAWLENRLAEFPKLQDMKRVDEDFPIGVQTGWVKPKPDLRFNTIEGEERLTALEAGMSQKRSWFDDDEGNATDWIQEPGNCFKLISDFESVDVGGSEYPKVWERFGWSHAPASSENVEGRDNLFEVARVLGLLEILKIETISSSINGISSWLDRWSKLILSDPRGINVWLKVWPLASAATNAEKGKGEADLDTTGRVVGDAEPVDLDTLNTPAGRLISVFFSVLSASGKGGDLFAPEQPLRRMRDIIFAGSERTLLIAQYRCVEFLSYFLNADREWTEEHLINPLKSQDSRAIVLWRSISRRIQNREAISVIGDELIARATDMGLGRESRGMLVNNLVIDSLRAYWSGEEPAIHHSKVQQMIRSVDDEVRVSGAEILQRFLRDSSNPNKNSESPTPSREELYSRAVKPFLREVWPQEKSLSTPGVSRALADLPVSAGDSFADAIRLIERFLVPFECWSLGDFGFYRAGRDELALDLIDSEDKAEAFLVLLDKTIGAQEGAIVPHELTHALEKIRHIYPRLSEEQAFRRLEAATRR